MKNQREQMMQDFNQDADALMGCLFFFFCIGAIIGTIGTIIYLNL